MCHMMNLFHNSMIKEESNANVMFLSCSGFLMKEKLVLLCSRCRIHRYVLYNSTQKFINYFIETRRSKDILTHRYNIMFRVSSELGPPPPHPQGSVAPPPLCVQGGRHTRACGRGGGRTQFRRKDRHWYSM
jgi:hypothetical protein